MGCDGYIDEQIGGFGMIEQEIQELADSLGFDLKKLPYGYKFKLGKASADYYHTTGTLVVCPPKKQQFVKKHVDIVELGLALKKLIGDPSEFINEQKENDIKFIREVKSKVKSRNLSIKEAKAIAKILNLNTEDLV